MFQVIPLFLLFFSTIGTVFSAVADIEKVLDSSDNPKSFRTIFGFTAGVTAKPLGQLNGVYFPLERLLITDRETVPALRARAELALEALRVAYLKLKQKNQISDIDRQKSREMGRILASTEDEAGARDLLGFRPTGAKAQFTFADLEFAYERMRQFFLDEDIQSATDRDQKKAYTILGRQFALLLPLITDYDKKGEKVIERILAIPDISRQSADVLLNPAKTPDTGGPFLELEKNYALLKAIINPANFKTPLTGQDLLDAEAANENLEQAYGLEMAKAIKQTAAGMANKKQMPKAIFEYFFLGLPDETDYKVDALEIEYQHMKRAIKSDEAAKMILREAYLRARLDASDYFDASVNNPAKGSFQRQIERIIDIVYETIAAEQAKDHKKVLAFKAGDDLETKYREKENELKEFKKILRSFREVKDSSPLIRSINDALDAVDDAYDVLKVNLPPSPPAPAPTPSNPNAPAPAPIPSSNPNPTKSDNEVDRANNCAQLKRSGLCSNPIYADLMRQQCAKTCKDVAVRAGNGADCKDKWPLRCPIWKKNNFCSNPWYKETDKKANCMKTCNLC